MSPTDRAQILALAVALLAPALVGIWRTATLRGDVTSEWGPRADVAHAELTDRATQELTAMQREITDLLGAGLSMSVPFAASIDPGLLANRAQAFQRALSMRARLGRDFRWLQKIGPAMVGGFALYAVGWLFATTFYSELWIVHWFRFAGLGLGGLGLFGLVILLAMYVRLEHRLSSAEIFAKQQPGQLATS